MSCAIKLRERDVILASLRAGVVPRVGLRHLQVGRRDEVAAVLGDLGRIERGGATVRFIIGRYGAGKSFFLHDLLTKVIFGEAGWVSTNMAAVRRSFALRAGAFSLITAATLAIILAWYVSYSRNSALIAELGGVLREIDLRLSELVPDPIAG